MRHQGQPRRFAAAPRRSLAAVAVAAALSLAGAQSLAETVPCRGRHRRNAAVQPSRRSATSPERRWPVRRRAGQYAADADPAGSAPAHRHRQRRVRRQSARAGGQDLKLPFRPLHAGRKFRAGRAERQPHHRRVPYAEAGQGPLRLRSADADRYRLRRQIDGGARPQAWDAGCLSAVADAVAVSLVRPDRPLKGHKCGEHRRRRCLRFCDDRREGA